MVGGGGETEKTRTYSNTNPVWALSHEDQGETHINNGNSQQNIPNINGIAANPRTKNIRVLQSVVVTSGRRH